VLRAICWFGLLTYFGAFLSQKLALSTGLVGVAYMLGGGGYFLGSVLSGGPLAHVPPRTLLVAGNVAMALLMGLAFSAILGPLGTVAMLPLAGFAGALGWVAVAALLTADSPAGAGTTMTLHGSLFNLGAAAGGAIGGLLLALAGYGALAIGLPIFGLASALLAWWPEHRVILNPVERTELG
jgi:predicted MFS family arabinose efflux permease